MTTGRDDADLGPALQRFVAGDRHALEDLPDREREVALQLALVFTPEANSDAEVPTAPIPQPDPIAVALGLVPGPDDVLNSSRLQAARKAAGLNLGQLTAAIQRRGWDVTEREVFGWHRADVSLPPALINTIAEELYTSIDSLRGVPARSRVVDYEDEAINNFIRDWATETGQDPAALRERTRRVLATVNYRNQGTVAREEALDILRALRRVDPDGTNL